MLWSSSLTARQSYLLSTPTPGWIFKIHTHPCFTIDFFLFKLHNGVSLYWLLFWKSLAVRNGALKSSKFLLPVQYTYSSTKLSIGKTQLCKMSVALPFSSENEDWRYFNCQLLRYLCYAMSLWGQIDGWEVGWSINWLKHKGNWIKLLISGYWKRAVEKVTKARRRKNKLLPIYQRTDYICCMNHSE